MNNILIKINQLKKQLKQWEYEYYALETPSVTDQEYDIALRTLIDLEKAHPEYITDDSPSKRIGGYVASHFKKVRHRIAMLSLSNVFSVAELRKFDNDIRKITNQSIVTYNVEPKIDGLSISLIYQNGKLIKALTRGDGEYGEDITMNAKTIKSIPLSINTDLKNLEVRGEAYMSFKEFESINSRLSEETQFANPRNAAAGSLRNLDSAQTAKRNLEMIAYYIPDESILMQLGINTQSSVIEQLRKWGFKIAAGVKKLDGIDEVIKYIEDFTNSRNQLPFPTDGAVIKLNDIHFYNQLGRTSKFPKWATAYKFPPELAETKLIDIMPTVGRTGRITYVASLEPVKLAGSTITSATLHNAQYIIEKDIRIGDYVKIFKAAEIIPKVLEVVLSKRTNDLKPFTPILRCPICNSILEKQVNEVDQYCTNISCKARIIQSMIHFCSKKAMNIEDLSDKNIEKLYEANIITNIEDIYHWDNKKSLVLSSDLKIKDKSFLNISQHINNSKHNSLEKLIFAIGIRHVGETTAKVLAKTYQDMNTLASAALDELLQINDIGETVAISIKDFFQNENNKKLLNALSELGVNMKYISRIDENSVDRNNQYYQKTFVITGTFDIPRHQIKQLLEQKYDANVIDSLTQNTDFLIVGKNGGSKIERANKLNIKIINEEIWK